VAGEVVCIASISQGLGSKERPRNRILSVLPARKMGQEPKKKNEGGEGGGLPSFTSYTPSLVILFFFLALASFFAPARHRKSLTLVLCSSIPQKRLLRRLWGRERFDRVVETWENGGSRGTGGVLKGHGRGTGGMCVL